MTVDRFGVPVEHEPASIPVVVFARGSRRRPRLWPLALAGLVLVVPPFTAGLVVGWTLL